MTLAQLLDRIDLNKKLWKSRYIVHQVQPGDTLISVAERYGIAPGTFRALNGGLSLVPFNDPQGSLEPYVGLELRVGIEVSRITYPGSRVHHLRDAAKTFEVELSVLEELNPKESPVDTQEWIRLPLPKVPSTPDTVKEQVRDSSREVLEAEAPPFIPSRELVFEGVPPAYDDDLLPEERLDASPYAFLIGDVLTHIPPEFIAVQRINQIHESGGLRTSTPVLSTDGQQETEVRFTMYFHGERGVNGIPVPSPYKQYTYSMDGLRAFLAQIHALPFLPVANEYLNQVWGIYALAIASVTVRTVPDFPDLFRVDVVAYHFNTYPYLLKEDHEFGDHFIWPLFRWYYQRMLHQDQKNPTRRYFAPYNPGSLPFQLYIMTEDAASGYEWEEEWQKVDLRETKVIEASFGYINVLTNTPMQGSVGPAYQYMGSLDDRVYLVLETTSREDVQALQLAVDDAARYARLYRNHIFKGYFKLEWDLAKTMGIGYCLVENLQVETIPQFPNTYRIALSLRVFDPHQNQQEKLEGFTGRAVPFDFETQNRDKIIEADIANEAELNKFNLYPDLDLPTYRELQAVWRQIQAFRREHHLGEMNLTHKHLDDPRLSNAYVEPDFYMAYQLEGLYSDMVEVLKEAESAGQEELPLQMIDPKKAEKVRTVPFLEPIPDQKIEDIVSGIWHDAFFYEPRGRLVRAFPTYLLLFIDEGLVINGQRLWDIPYVSHALIEVQWTEEKRNPVASCQIILHDVYGATQTTYWRRAVEQGLWERFFPTLNEEMLDIRRELVRQRMTTLLPGVRMHLRVGYGSLGSQLPVAFNGTVAEITRGPEVVLVAQSDGAELTQPVPGWLDDQWVKNTGTPMLGLGTEPYELIKNLLAMRDTTFNLTQRWGMESPLGINHFGLVTKDVYLQVFGIELGAQRDDEIAKNIYPARLEDVDEGEESRLERRTKLLNPPQPRFGNDEPNIQIWLHRKSTWDVAQTLAAAIPDYIFAVHKHQFRSTAFFGLPHWPVRYGFWLENGRLVERYKPFIQGHFAQSHTDLILNGLRASSNLLATVAHVQYHEGNSLRTVTLYADRSIRSDRQRSIVVDTGIVQDFGSFRLPFVNKSVDILPDKVLRYAGIRFGEAWARRAGKQALRAAMAEMYQGEIAILGDSTVKPWDLLYLMDGTLQMSGAVQVGRVTHVLSGYEGFRTIIKPDLLVTVADSSWSEVTKHVLSVSGGLGILFARNSLANLGRKIVMGQNAQKAIRYGAKALEGARALARTERAARTAVRATQILQRLRNIRLIKRGVSIGRMVAAGVAAAGAAVASAPVALGSIAVAVVGTLLTDYIIDSLEAWLVSSDRVIQLSPIYYKNAPYVAGIDGHEHLIPGWTDRKIMETRAGGGAVVEQDR